MSGRVEGKVAIVTGAGTTGSGVGIGHAISVALGREGASVLLVDNVPENAEATRRVIEDKGGKAGVFAGDVSRPADCEAMVAAATETFGALDILVNNAAISRHVSILETSVELYESVIGINLTGSFMACKFAIPALIARGGGSIVNIGSIAGVTALGRGHVGYSMAMAAVVQMTRELSTEWSSRGVRVNAILPAQVVNPSLEARMAADPKLKAKFLSGIPAGRLGTPDDIRGLAVFLASDASSWITGAIIPMDGGNLAMNAGGTKRE